jgi:hypothetical protein
MIKLTAAHTHTHTHTMCVCVCVLITDLDPHFTIPEFPSLLKRFPDPSRSLTGIDMFISVQKHISTISERLHTHTFNTHFSSWDFCNCMTDNDTVNTWPTCGSYIRHLKTSNVNFYISIPSQIIWSKTGICGGLSVNIVIIAGLHKVNAIPWLAEDLLTSLGGVWST